MNISRIANTVVDYGVGKPLRKLSESKVMNKVCEKYANDKTTFIAGLGVASIVLKDGLGCYMYVKQSLANDKIPSDKRKFVAALDLANGGLMVLSQLAAFFTVSNDKVQEKMFNATVGKLFDRPARKGYQAIIKSQEKFKNLTGKEFIKSFEGFQKGLRGSFKIVTSLVASTILAKRVVVPFIATPLADKTKKWLSRNDKPQTVHPETKNTFKTTNVENQQPVELKSQNLLQNLLMNKQA